MKIYALLVCSAVLYLVGNCGSGAKENVAIPLIPRVIGFDAEPFSPSIPKIMKAKIKFDKRRYVSWDFLPERDQLWLYNNEIALVPTEKVIRGFDAVKYWEYAATLGEVCENSKTFHGPFFEGVSGTSEDCAFTRKDGSWTEYCIYSRQGAAQSAYQCQDVMRSEGRTTSVLASRSIKKPTRGAGGEGLHVCEFPGVTLNEARQKIEQMLQALVGTGGVVDLKKVGPRYVVSTRGTNLSFYHKNFLVRLNLIGEMANFIDGAQTYSASSGSAEDYSGRVGNGVMLSYSRSFTVSPRRPNSIIDYREPEKLDEEQITREYWRLIKPLLTTVSADFKCQFFQI